MHIRRILALILAQAHSVLGQQYDASLYGDMRWRQIGPFRAGRVSLSPVFLAMRPSITWHARRRVGKPWTAVPSGLQIFDQEHVASVGAIAVAPSKTEIVYGGHG